jgi:hypothetical protein
VLGSGPAVESAVRVAWCVQIQPSMARMDRDCPVAATTGGFTSIRGTALEIACVLLRVDRPGTRDAHGEPHALFFFFTAVPSLPGTEMDCPCRLLPRGRSHFVQQSEDSSVSDKYGVTLAVESIKWPLGAQAEKMKIPQGRRCFSAPSRPTSGPPNNGVSAAPRGRDKMAGFVPCRG